MNKQSTHVFVMAIIFPLIASLLTTGCATARFKLTQVHQPVMLGNVEKIGGTDSTHGRIKTNIRIESLVSNSGEGSVTGNTEGIEMLVRLKQPRRPDAAKEKIVIQSVYFRSMSGLMIILYGGNVGMWSWTGVTGVIYEDADAGGDRGKRDKDNGDAL